MIAANAVAAERPTRVFESTDGIELTVEVYGAPGHTRLLWLHPSFGDATSLRESLERVAGAGLESWLADPATDRFLPRKSEYLDEVPATDLATLMAAGGSDRELVVVTTGRGVQLLLRALGELPPGRQPMGAILFSPNLYRESPEVGKDARFTPAIENLHIPVVVAQPTQSAGYWRVNETVEALRGAAGEVQLRTLGQVRDNFFMREMPLPEERRLDAGIGALMNELVNLLEHRKP